MILEPPRLTKGKGRPVTGNRPTATAIFMRACVTMSRASPRTMKESISESLRRAICAALKSRII